ncbi:MAG: glycosyltransferase [Candidatus Omnitrophica bacterium]|nr:glycosyltransferase [Candidatus Omnitrophota bacterium]MDD5770815.1 glycosyltransferase [Candidatus Omnitrophota bacterium]
MQSKRIILMYISEVSGHRSATMAIEKAIRTLSPKCEILNINAFNYTNPISEKVINRIYMEVIKYTPKIWDYLYDNPKVVKGLEKIKKSVHKSNSPKLKKLFNSFKPDVVVCTQAFPCGMVADYKKAYGVNLPLVAVLTDYIPHSYWVYDNVDYYITPSDDVSERLVKKGVAASRVRSFGIPFDHKFNQKQDREEIFRKLGLDPRRPVILIMGGGQGLGPIKTIVKSLEASRYDIQELIVTGTNKKLYSSLKRKVRRYKKDIHLFGFVQNIHELMHVSGLIISKPGGVTTAEVLSARLPMVIVKPIPGQEANNTNFLTGKGAAVKVDDPGDVHRIIDELLGDDKRLERLKLAAASIAKPDASMDIARLILNA